MQLRVIGTALLFLNLLCGCSKAAPELIEVPAPLVSPVQEPDVSRITTNGDLLEIFLDYQLALRVCNGKLSSIEKVYSSHR